MFCSECGTEIADGAKYCENCGSAIYGDAKDSTTRLKTSVDGNRKSYIRGETIGKIIGTLLMLFLVAGLRTCFTSAQGSAYSTLEEYCSQYPDEYRKLQEEVQTNYSIPGLAECRVAVVENEIQIIFALPVGESADAAEQIFMSLINQAVVKGSEIENETMQSIQNIENEYGIEGITMGLYLVNDNNEPMYSIRFSDKGYIS